jgi:hypothetical protein
MEMFLSKIIDSDNSYFKKIVTEQEKIRSAKSNCISHEPEAFKLYK